MEKIIFNKPKKKGVEIVPKKNKNEEFILYHGTPGKFDEFKTPTENNELNVVEGGVIYLTSDIEVAKRYAGPGGFVCIARVKEPVQYAIQLEKQNLPKKHRKYTRNVYIQTSDKVKIDKFIDSDDIEIIKK